MVARETCNVTKEGFESLMLGGIRQLVVRGERLVGAGEGKLTIDDQASDRGGHASYIGLSSERAEAAGARSHDSYRLVR
jgi:hypothetical protein